MKPAPFEYFDPKTVEEAVSLLREHGEDAKVLAGGQSLMPLLNMRMARPEALIEALLEIQRKIVRGEKSASELAAEASPAA